MLQEMLNCCTSITSQKLWNIYNFFYFSTFSSYDGCYSFRKRYDWCHRPPHALSFCTVRGQWGWWISVRPLLKGPASHLGPARLEKAFSRVFGVCSWGPRLNQINWSVHPSSSTHWIGTVQDVFVFVWVFRKVCQTSYFSFGPKILII